MIRVPPRGGVNVRHDQHPFAFYAAAPLEQRCYGSGWESFTRLAFTNQRVQTGLVHNCILVNTTNVFGRVHTGTGTRGIFGGRIEHTAVSSDGIEFVPNHTGVRCRVSRPRRTFSVA